MLVLKVKIILNRKLNLMSESNDGPVEESRPLFALLGGKGGHALARSRTNLKTITISITNTSTIVTKNNNSKSRNNHNTKLQ